MKADDVKGLISSLHDTDIVELSFEKEGFKLMFRRDEDMLAGSQRLRKEVPAPPSEIQKPVLPQKTVQEIKSPMVGTFYSSPSPDRPPMIIEGDHVMPGQKICMIEAMKVMKDVMSTVQGKVEQVLVQNGHAVEYGQPLFLIDTTDHASNGK